MKLISLKIENFGKLNNFEINFENNITSIKQENGWGKSTLATFLKAMFYGLSSGSKELDKNERKKFMPWQGGVFGGSVVFEVGGKTYKLSRFFGATASKDTFSLIDLKTNKPSFDFSSDIGKELFQLDANGFERSIFINNKNLEFPDKDSVIEKLNAMLQNTNDQNNFSSAYEILDKERKKLKNSEIPQLSDRISALKREIDYLNNLKIETDNYLERVVEINELVNSINLCLEKVNNDLTIAQNQNQISFAKQTKINLENQIKDLQNQIEELKNNFKIVPSETELITYKQNILNYENNKNKLNELNNRKQEIENSKIYSWLNNKKTSCEEIETYITKLKANVVTDEKKQNKISFFVGLAISIIVMVLGGILFVNENKFALIVLVFGLLGLIACVFMFLFSYIKKINQFGVVTDNPQVKEFLLNFYKYDEFDQLLPALVNLQSNWKLYEEKVKSLNEINEKITALNLQTQKLNDEIYFFKQKFLNKDLPLLFIEETIFKINQFTLTLNNKQSEYEKFVKDNSELLIKNQVQTKSLEVLKTEQNEMFEEKNKLLQELAKLETKINQNQNLLEKLSELETELTDKEEKLKEKSDKLDTVLKAQKFLEQAQENITSKYLKPMENAFNDVLNTLNVSNFEKFNLDSDLNLTVEQNGKRYEINYLSKGYQNLLEFALRISLVKVLFTNELPFIILDDPFTNIDENKMQMVINLLKAISQKYQIIYLTCHQSRYFKA